MDTVLRHKPDIRLQSKRGHILLHLLAGSAQHESHELLDVVKVSLAKTYVVLSRPSATVSAAY